MKTVAIFYGSAPPLSPLAALGFDDPHFFRVYEVGTNPGQVHPDKVRHLKDSGPHPFWFGKEMMDEGLISPIHANLLCAADCVLE